jgi:2-polyprenyl-6-methoxyphenol hydroxylase-like FAD-dependent oxidoreductase
MYDVVIVGASVGGCATAIALSRQGLRVVLLEKHRNPATPKGPCGHFVLGGAHDALVRLGAWDRLVAAGAAVGDLELCTDYGPLAPRARPVPPVLNARRTLIDPTLRSLAAETPGVDLRLGAKATDVLTRDGRIHGVRARVADGGEHEFTGRLVVAADGHRSPVAKFAGVPAHTVANPRAFAYGYFRLHGPRPDRAMVWAIDGWWYVASPTDDGLVEVVAMPPSEQLPPGSVPHSWLVERVSRLPGAPDLAGEPVGKVVVARNYAPTRRDPTPRPGLALVGDAALTGDPTPAVGITWALRSAGWLTDAVLANHARGRDLAALAAYRRAHAALRREFRFQNGDTRRGAPNPIQRLLWRGATYDPELASKVSLVGNQVAPVTSLLGPTVLWRAATVRPSARRDHPDGSPTPLGAWGDAEWPRRS